VKHTKEVALKSYPEWDMSMPTISSRSRLYRLEPIGIGTPYVESLTSYVARLAGKHHVSPKILVMKEIYPALNEEVTTPQQYSRLDDFWMGSHSINGNNLVAKQWVEVLQTLTSCNGLKFLTMLILGETIAPNKLFRSKKAWCCWCYDEQQRQSQAVYEPLLWGLDGIGICPRHQQPLVDRCPHCQAMTPFLTHSSRPGYCSHCARWLGNGSALQAPVSLSPDEREFARQLWRKVSVIYLQLHRTCPQRLLKYKLQRC
jgi:hypothetical protein